MNNTRCSVHSWRGEWAGRRQNGAFSGFVPTPARAQSRGLRQKEAAPSLRRAIRTIMIGRRRLCSRSERESRQARNATGATLLRPAKSPVLVRRHERQRRQRPECTAARVNRRQMRPAAGAFVGAPVNQFRRRREPKGCRTARRNRGTRPDSALTFQPLLLRSFSSPLRDSKAHTRESAFPRDTVTEKRAKLRPKSPNAGTSPK